MGGDIEQVTLLSPRHQRFFRSRIVCVTRTRHELDVSVRLQLHINHQRLEDAGFPGFCITGPKYFSPSFHLG